MSAKVRVTAVNHVAQDIACNVGVLYTDILDTYVDGRKFADRGYAVVQLSDSDPAAFRGGYQISAKNDRGELVDDRIFRVIERDDQARRVSLRADYLLPSQMGLTVYATYQAEPTSGGARYRIDCYTDMDVELPADNTKSQVSDVVRDFEKQSEDLLKTYLGRLKEKFEA